MADSRRNVLGRPLDVEQIRLDAQSRWLRPAEILEILLSYNRLQLAPQPADKPPSGSLFLYDRRAFRYFRKDGHNWKKKKDGKTVKEAYERLKVGNVDVLHAYYAHGENYENFQRRTYWMHKPELSHIVLVHYLEVKQGEAAASLRGLLLSYRTSATGRWSLIRSVVTFLCLLFRNQRIKRAHSELMFETMEAHSEHRVERMLLSSGGCSASAHSELTFGTMEAHSELTFGTMEAHWEPKVERMLLSSGGCSASATGTWSLIRSVVIVMCLLFRNRRIHRAHSELTFERVEAHWEPKVERMLLSSGGCSASVYFFTTLAFSTKVSVS